MSTEPRREEKGPTVNIAKNNDPVRPSNQQSRTRKPTTSIWEDTQKQDQTSKLDTTPDMKNSDENINALFLGCIQQLNANILQMKKDMNQNVKEIVQNTLAEKAYLPQNLQPNPYNMPITFLRPQNPSEIASLQQITPSQTVQTQQVLPVSSLQPTSQ